MYRDVVSSDRPKEVWFDDNIEVVIDKETSVGEQNSQFDLNMNPPDDDPIMSVIDIPISLMQDL